MKRTILLLGMVAFAATFVSVAVAQEKTPPTTQPAADEPLCPVTGERIDRAISVQFRGKPVYFATAAARGKFEEDPYEYAEGIRKQWEALRPLRVQVLCPVSGKPVDLKVSLTRAGEPLYFATAAARTAWEKNARAYEEKLPACYTFQTICPCGVGEIKPDVTMLLEQRTIYFCCTGCRETFKRHPELFVGDMDARTKANQQNWEKRHPRPTADQP